MKIAIVTQSYYPRPGGVTENTHHCARELRLLGHEATLVTTRFSGEESDDDGVIRIGRNMLVPMNGAWVNMTVGLSLGRKLRETLHRLEPDIVHTHCPLVPTLPLLTLVNKPPGARVVGTFHAAAESNYAYRALRKRLERFAERLDARIAVSEAARKLAAAYFPGHYFIIPNGVDLERFSPHTPPIPELVDGSFNILFVGRLDKRKGFGFLRAAAAALARRTSRRIRLVVVGDRSLRRFLQPAIGGRLEVFYAGIVSRDILPRYYASCDIFCSPAVGNESFGIVLLEAMASGIPIVATSIPGYLTVLRPGWNSLTVKPRDTSSLSRGLEQLMEDRNLASRLVENGLKHVQDYSWRRIAARLRDLYESLLSTELQKERDEHPEEEQPALA